MPDVVQRLLKDADRHMLEAIDAVRRDFSLIRTGRANPAVLDRIRVEYYGQKVPIK
ncbi:MAG: ribosome recycling factor, partial [Gemmatimonadales bacterium]|nr:ribosome recycling factor [Gemmatimonadales bacterium]